MLNDLLTQAAIRKIHQFKVDELKVVCARLGMSRTGKKAELQLKITNALQANFEKINEAIDYVHANRFEPKLTTRYHSGFKVDMDTEHL